jgi:hypothetical protein
MKKTIGKTALTLVAAIVMILLVAVLMAVPAFASESDMTTQNNEQFEIVDPKYEGDANNYVTLPDAPAKDGYTFKGWSIDSSTELHHAGESIVNNDGHKLQLEPVYEAKSATPETTSVPVTTPKYTSDAQQGTSDTTVQNAAHEVDGIDFDSRLCAAIIGMGLFLLALILLLVARVQAWNDNDGIATVLAVLALIAAVAGVAFCVYGCAGLFAFGVATGGEKYLLGFAITFILLQFAFHSK